MLWRRPACFLYIATINVSLTTKSVRGMASTAAKGNKRSLLVDTDVGFDDLVSLQCLMNTRRLLKVTTVGGVVSAPKASRVLRGLYPQLEIYTGRNAPIMPYDPLPVWLVNYRTKYLDEFCNDMGMSSVTVDNLLDENGNDVCQTKDVVSNILNAHKEDGSVDILAIGPLTNLSDWLAYCENNPNDSPRKVNSIYILGGNHPDDTTFQAPEFNFGLDPSAARHVLTSPLVSGKVHLITSSVCKMDKLKKSTDDQQIQAFLEDQQKKGGFLCNLLKYDVVGYSLTCDPVCAFALEHPAAVTWDEHVRIRVDVAGTLVSSDENGSMIRIASHIDLREYLPWVRATI